MNIRPLTSSEKTLLLLCGVALGGVGLVFTVRDHRARAAAALEKIAELEPQADAAVTGATDAPFWEERRAWLDKTMPVIKDEGQEHSAFLASLQDTAKERGLSLTSPVLLKPESGKHARDLSVTLQVTGSDSAVFRWLADLQSPEKFQVVKYLQLIPQSVSPPRMSGNVTIARLFQP